MDPALPESALPLLLPTLIAIAAFFVKRRADELARRRELCSKALAAALDWLEVPYRIRRREDESAAARVALADGVHELQQRMTFYQAWLRVELPSLALPYESLCAAVKRATVDATQRVWGSPGVRRDSDMNVGGLDIAEMHDETAAFVRSVRHELSLWRGLLPW